MRQNTLYRTVFALLILILAGFVFVLAKTYPPMDEALLDMKSDETYIYEDSDGLAFLPKNQSVIMGLVFYPGGLVDERAYVPLAKALTQKGYAVFIADMPFNLAIFSPDRARSIIASHPEIRVWAIGGHSLGGVMAAQYAYRYPEEIDALVLLASYPQSKYSLRDKPLKVISIWGTKDGFVDAEKMESSRSSLPEDAVYIPIKGGNHSQMGWYGFQKGDNTADITREEQQRQIVEALAHYLK